MQQHEGSSHSSKQALFGVWTLVSIKKISHMASSSVMRQVSTAIQPQVFINFRGSELRRSFIAFLEPAMREANINVFIDELELMGTDLENLLVRIEESKVALAIFSKDYTSSVWCLDELVKIKECKDQGGLKVIPIFYNLDPLVVKELRGDFGDKFRDLQRRHLHQLERTRKWEEALVTIPDIRGIPRAEQRLMFVFLFYFFFWSPIFSVF